MTHQTQAPDPPDQKSRRYKIGFILFLVGLLVAFFLLGQSMVNHRFFRGSRMDRNGHLTQ